MADSRSKKFRDTRNKAAATKFEKMAARHDDGGEVRGEKLRKRFIQTVDAKKRLNTTAPTAH